MISVQHLAKQFGGIRAVDGLSFEVPRGQILGFLGPNGAGKSTTMRMITGYLRPTAGRVEVEGLDVARHPVRTKSLIGYLPESAPGYGELTVNEFLRFSAEIRGLRGRTRKAAVERAVGRCFLEAVRHQAVATLSKGFRHRTCLAQSMVHDPPVLIMDEPTDGLDPNQKHEIRGMIREMGRGKVIVFSTHILEEVEAVCDRAILIDRGRLVADGTPAALKAQAQGAGDLLIRMSSAHAEAACAAWAKIDGVASAASPRPVAAGGVSVRLQVGPAGGDAAAVAVMGCASENGWLLYEVSQVEGRLDRFFRDTTAGEKTSADGGR